MPLLAATPGERGGGEESRLWEPRDCCSGFSLVWTVVDRPCGTCLEGSEVDVVGVDEDPHANWCDIAISQEKRMRRKRKKKKEKRPRKWFSSWTRIPKSTD